MFRWFLSSEMSMRLRFIGNSRLISECPHFNHSKFFDFHQSVSIKSRKHKIFVNGWISKVKFLDQTESGRMWSNVNRCGGHMPSINQTPKRFQFMEIIKRQMKKSEKEEVNEIFWTKMNEKLKKWMKNMMILKEISRVSHFETVKKWFVDYLLNRMNLKMRILSKKWLFWCLRKISVSKNSITINNESILLIQEWKKWWMARNMLEFFTLKGV